MNTEKYNKLDSPLQLTVNISMMIGRMSVMDIMKCFEYKDLNLNNGEKDI